MRRLVRLERSFCRFCANGTQHHRFRKKISPTAWEADVVASGCEGIVLANMSALLLSCL